jgi:lambda repressor-like predicted transcriptional regulator
MSWKPTPRQLYLIAEYGAAHMPAEVIAAALDITPEEFSAWAARLIATRAHHEMSRNGNDCHHG